MADVDWAVWMKGKLDGVVALDAVFPGSALEEAPRVKPFAIFHLDQEVRGAFPGHSLQNASVWVHDEPGSYHRIGQILRDIRDAFCGSGYTTGQAGAPNGGGVARWVSSSGELVDDEFKTIVRYGTFQLHAGDGYG